MKKRVWVPEVLRRVFGAEVRTLAHTIVSLASQHQSSSVSPVDCSCSGRCCLQCSAQNLMSFLLRPDDPFDYRNLLYKCFVVVNHNGPPLLDVSPESRWPQHEIVARSIEMIIYQHSMSSNVICSGYDKYKRSSPIVECLTSSAWIRLLKRVGDNIMIYILMWTSLFMELPNKKHCQVAGPPLSKLCRTLLSHKSDYQCGAVIQFTNKKRKGSLKKRKILNDNNSTIKRQCVDSLFKADSPMTSQAARPCGVNTSNVDENSSSHITVKPNKRKRPFAKQRRKERRKLDSQDCADIFSDDISVTKKLQVNLNDKRPSQCPCCLTLQAPRSITHADKIGRQSMFYNLGTDSSVFLKNHILNTLKPNFSGSKVLLENIFGLSKVNIHAHSIACFHSRGSCRLESECLYHLLIKFLKILIRRTRRCQHMKLLNKHCPVPSTEDQIKSSTSLFPGCELGDRADKQSDGNNSENYKEPVEASGSQFDEVKSYCTKSQVVSFIWAVCRRIVPEALLGTSSNWRILRKNIAKFIRLKRFENFSVRQCLYKMKLSRFPILSNRRSTCYSDTDVLRDQVGQTVSGHEKLNDAIPIMKHKLLENWIVWLFSSIVVPLVQSNFYVTESQQGKRDVCFYRKSIWKKLTKRSIIGLNDKNYIHLDEASARDIISKRSFGFSKLRLLPKENGVRILANLNAFSRFPAQKSPMNCRFVGTNKSSYFHKQPGIFDHFKPVNFVLRDTHAVMKGIQLTEPDKLGSSVFDYNDVYRKLCPFLAGLKTLSKIRPGVFIVVSDVAKAFDSIDQDKMLTVMKDVVLKTEYYLEHSHQVVCMKKSLWVRENLTSVDAKNGFTRFTTAPSSSLHSILINQGKTRCITREKLFFDLDELVKRNVLKLDRNFYLQSRGIPQGSIISSLLCSLYYGHLEKNVIFPFLDSTCQTSIEDLSTGHDYDNYSSRWNNMGDSAKCQSYILLRFTDDFLFISTSKNQAASFFNKLKKGFKDYNCYMNDDKFGANFDIDGLPANRVYVGEDGISFLQWSGLLINCCSLEVQADYSRYLNNHLRSSLTISSQGKSAQRLKSKLRGYMRPKCHALFFDSNINSPAIVRLNIYQGFLLCAMKFHCYVSELSSICKLHPKSYLEIIEGSLRYMYVLIKRRMRTPSLKSLHPVLRLEEEEVQWLGLYAYIDVLKRKQSQHRKLLSFLQSKLSAHKFARSLSFQLEYAVDKSHSSLLWKIKF